MKSLQRRNVLITGAAGGLGPYITREFQQEGANLVLVSLPAEEEALRALAESLSGGGVRCLPVAADITQEQDRAAIVDAAQAGLGEIDVLVNGAAIGEIRRFCDYTADSVAHIVDTNLTATLLLTRRVLPEMVARGTGQVVTLASMAGWVPTPYNSVYAATKAGLIAWTRALRVELAGTGVGASVVCPSYVSGAGMHARHHVKAAPIAREVTPERVARAVLGAVRDDRLEVLVTAMPIRPLLALSTLWPAFQRGLLSAGGFYGFAERLLARQTESRRD